MGDPLARNRRRLVVVAGAGLLVAAAALGWTLAPENDTAPEASAATATATDPPKTIPPSAGTEPAQATATDPEATVSPGAPDTPAPTQAGPRDVSVVLTYAGYMPESGAVIAGGFADAVIENDGTCTLTLTRGGTTRTASGPASADVAGTSCGELKVPQAELSSGEWQATISYSSARSRGTSSPFPVEMP
jgi:hypothetical protein